jgi:hypothetical protein
MNDTPLLEGFDCAEPLSGPIIMKAAAHKVAFVGRYLWKGGKGLLRAEALNLAHEEIGILSFYEGMGTEYATFTVEQAQKDAAAAIGFAKIVGQTANTPITFAVDFDANAAQINSGIAQYFGAIASVLRGQFRVGVYGSGNVCNAMLGKNFADFAVLAGAGWGGSASFTKWNVHQHPTIMANSRSDTLRLGISYDPLEAKPGDSGIWKATP